MRARKGERRIGVVSGLAKLIDAEAKKGIIEEAREGQARKRKKAALARNLSTWRKRISRLESLLPAKDRANAIIVLPSGQRVSLVEARERLIERFSWLGIRPQELRQKLATQLQEFKTLKEIVDAFSEYDRKGLRPNFTEIARRFGVDKTTVRLWLFSGRLPKNVSLKRADLYEGRRKPIEFNAKNQPDYAYIIGAMFGQETRRGSQEKRVVESMGLNLAAKDKGFGKEFRARLKNISGEEVNFVEREGLEYHAFLARNLTQILNRETEYLTRIPIQILETRKARTDFLKGLFDSHGTLHFSGPKKIMSIELPSTNPELIKHTSLFLQELGIEHSIGKTKISEIPNIVIRIWSKGIPQFREAIGFREKAKQGKISRVE